jgi:hypothetical protein
MRTKTSPLVKDFAGSMGILLLALGIVFGIALSLSPVNASVNGCNTSCPPENVFVKVYEPTGPPLWIDFIGTGSNGDSPVRDSIRTMTADGFYLRARPKGACGMTKRTACVVIGP